jgi:hypothetical protein
VARADGLAPGDGLASGDGLEHSQRFCVVY